MQITLKLENIEAVKRKLEDIEGNITDTARLMGEIANYLYNISKEECAINKAFYGIENE